MKKKRLAAALAAKKQVKAPEVKSGGFMNVVESDLGASPQMSKGAIYQKNQGGGGKWSPLHQATQYKLGRR